MSSSALFRLLGARFDPTTDLQEQLFTDLELHGSDPAASPIRCHAVVLAGICPLLRQALQGQPQGSSRRVVILPDCTTGQVQALVDAVYKGEGEAREVLELMGCFKKQDTEVIIEVDEVKKKLKRKRGRPKKGIEEEEIMPKKTCSFVCPAPSCPESFSDMSLQTEHIYSQHERIKCPLCDEMPRSANYEVHWKKRHPLLKEGDVSCPVCSERITSEAFLPHMRSRHPVQKSEEYSEPWEGELTSEFKFEKSLEHPERTFCPMETCLESFNEMEEVYSHLSGLHECPICPKCDKPVPALGRHGRVCSTVLTDVGNKSKRKHLPEDAEIELNAGDPGQCPQCQYRNPVQRKMKAHIRSVHVKVPCPHCEKRYSLYFLQRHVATKHEAKTLDHACHLCSMRFFRQRLLKYHIEESHTKVLKCVCEHCGTGCFSQAQLSRHKAHFHGTSSRNHPCSLCNKSYLNKDSLKKHTRLHHPEIYKPGKGRGGRMKGEELSSYGHVYSEAKVEMKA